MMQAVAVGLISLLALGGIFWYEINRKKKWKQLYSSTFHNCLSGIIQSTHNFNLFTVFERGYFSNYDLTLWKNEATSLLKIIDGIPRLRNHVSKEKLNIISGYRELYALSEEARTGYNNEFVKHELAERQGYFSSILTHPLDDEQRTAIVTDEDHNLVIAGAGCGKTTTITGKVKYILDRYGVPKDEITLISFTRKSSDDMKQKVHQEMKLDVPIQTFHSWGLEIIAQATGEKPSVIEEHSVRPIITNSFSENKKSEDYLRKLNEFFLSYLKIPPSEEICSDEETLRTYLKGNDITSLYQIPVNKNGYVTYERQYCRSHEEVLIANFLYLNQIKYEYERNYPINTATSEYRQYQPDFFLPEYGIYIEHYGVDENGNVPAWFGHNAKKEFVQWKYDEQNKAYKDKMQWADELHALHRTRLVKTYSWENKRKELLTSLEEKLKGLNVQFRPLSPLQVWATIAQSAEKDVTDFEMMLTTFLSLLKSNHQTINYVRQNVRKIENTFYRQRAEAFLDLFTPIYSDYEKKLKEQKKIDFNDMINKACELVKAGKSNRKYSYIIVDEFQDISIGRYKLLKALLDQNPGCKLFCVGDDWQSIYRFTGSDIALFTNFEQFFGVTKTSHITSTYRFPEEIINLTTSFIQSNPNQVKKKLKSRAEQHRQCIEIITSVSRYDRDVNSVKIALGKIIEHVKSRREDPAKIKVKVLGRYNHDRQIFDENKKLFTVNTNTSEITYIEAPTLKIEFQTIHAAKGLESDYVIIVNCNAGKYGLPSERADDPILNLLLSAADQFENGEERRLFYVALTRTRRKVFLLTWNGNQSKFIKEIEAQVADKKTPQAIRPWPTMPL